MKKARKTFPRHNAVYRKTGNVLVLVKDVYGSNIPSTIPRPTGRGPRPPARVIPRPFPWEKPIPLNSRDIELELRRYTDPAERRVARWLYSTWNAESDAIKFQELRNAVRDGEVPRAWIAQWKQDYSDYVNNVLDPEWRRGWGAGASYMAGHIANSLGVTYIFPDVTRRLNEFVNARGAELAVNLTKSQTLAVRNIVRHFVVDKGMGPAALGRYIRPTIGLTPREAAAVVRRRELLVAQGLKEKQIIERVENYSGFLLRRRAERIARTETAFAFEYGTFDGVKTAQEEGLFAGSVVLKKYSTSGDERVCPFCGPLDGQEIGLDSTFPGLTERLPNVLVPPVHPNCRCTVIYEVVPANQVDRDLITPAPSRPGVPTSVLPELDPPVAPPTPPPVGIPEETGWFPAETVDDATRRVERHFPDGMRVNTWGTFTDDEKLNYLNTVDAEFTRCRAFADTPVRRLAVDQERAWKLRAVGVWDGPIDNATITLNRSKGIPLGTGEDLVAVMKRARPTVGGDVPWELGKRGVPRSLRSDLPWTIRHEFAHQVETIVGVKDPALWGEWITFYIKNNRNGKLFRNISKYSKKNASECFAEIFTIYSSPKFVPGTLDAALGDGTEDLIRRMLKSAERNKP